MVNKASILLLLLFGSPSNSFAIGIDGLIKESVSRKDWPELILLLEPIRGQNFEHDLELARAYLALERRIEAIDLLSEVIEKRPSLEDERVNQLYNAATEIFFNQETADLYYQAVQLIRSSRLTEAKEKLDLALQKEPGQFLLLKRSVQVDLALQVKQNIAEHLLPLLKSPKAAVETKILNQRWLFLSDKKDEKTLFQNLQALKWVYLQHELTFVWYLDHLKSLKKEDELKVLAQKSLTDYKNLGFVLKWFYVNHYYSELKKPSVKEMIVKISAQKVEQASARAFWDGILNLDDLMKNLN